MTTRVWRLGAVDSIQAPYDWTPFGAPQIGDTLVLRQGTAFLGPDPASPTIVLSNSDLVDTPPPTLVVFGHAHASVLVDNAPGVGVVDVFQAPTVHLSIPVEGDEAAINVCATSQMRGDVTELGAYASAFINGDTTSTFANETSRIENSGSFGVAVNVAGIGTFDVGSNAHIEFLAGVSAGQTINVTGGWVDIEDTKDFHATVTLSESRDLGGITLGGLVADSYTFHNDLMSFTSGGRDVFDLKLTAPEVWVDFGRGPGPYGGKLPSAILITTIPVPSPVTFLHHA